MARKSIYRCLRKDCHEIRVLQPERSADSPDGLLKYRLEYIVLDDDPMQAAGSTCTLTEQENTRGKHTSIVEGYAWHKQRKTTSGKGFCNGAPPYIALSYTWGDAQDTVPIQVAGRVKKVTRNLRDALAAIRAEHRTASLPVWADAVCINQGDHIERNQEVKRMAEIYRRAANVIIWLGYVPATWNFFGLQPTNDINDIEPRLLVKQKAEATDILQQEDYTSDEVLALVAIFDPPYWRRIWILQELATARFSGIFFFWAGELRHISVLHNVYHVFSELVNAWLESSDVTSFLSSVSASENWGIGIGRENLDAWRNLVDSNWRTEFMRASTNRVRSKLVQANSNSDIAERLMLATIAGQKFDVLDYLQKKSPQNSYTSASEMEQEIHNLKEVIQALALTGNDERWEIKRTEMKLAVNELSMKTIDIISAASLDTSKEEVDFGLLMRQALHGQCTNNIDLVYGLLGLHQREIVSQITADYRLSSERVFSDFSAAVIRSRGLSFLCQYGSSLSGISDNLPSWVVNLRKNSDHIDTIGEWSQKWRKFGAGGVGSDHIQFSADSRRLLCPGLLYKVDTKTPQPNYYNKDLIRQALERVVSCYHPDEEARRSILNISPQSISDDPEVIAILEDCQAFQTVHSDLTIEGLQLKDLFPLLDDIVDWDMEAASKGLKNVSAQNIFTTIDGKLGLGADVVRDGDWIAVLQGCNVPAILREREGGYGLIGMCYLDGVMCGEALGANTDWKQLTIL